MRTAIQFPFFPLQPRRTKAPRRTSSSRQVGRGLEQLEDRRVLATIPVTVTSDVVNPVNDGKITLREAITYVNTGVVPQLDLAQIDRTEPFGTNDEIVFAESLAQQTINITGSNLVVTKRVTITGPSAGFVYINDASSSANTGITFSGFDLRPPGVTGDTGISGVLFNGFDVGIALSELPQLCR